MATEEKDEAESDIVKDLEEAKKRRTLFASREDYKQQRLEKILKAKETESPSFEEL